MLKKVIVSSIILLGINTFGYATTNDALGLAGVWSCYGYDVHDGGYKNATLTLTLDAKDSRFANNYGAYHLQLNDGGNTYRGEVAANGNTAGVYFENTSSKMPTDRGVGIAVITHDRDPSGKTETVLHKFYYQPDYEGGGNGSETCVKK